MADILIKGMEMPKCGYRTVEIAFDADGHPMALADGGDVFDVIPVPSHGRLIDADALFKRLFVGQDGQRYPNKNVDGWDNTYNFRVIKHEIIMAPTIIPAEPRVVKWREWNHIAP